MNEPDNLAREPDVKITCSIGGRSSSPDGTLDLLKNDNVSRLNQDHPLHFWRGFHFNSFSLKKPDRPVHFTIRFPRSVLCNCIEMTMGFIRIDGGWWTSLDVEYLDESSKRWRPAEDLEMDPSYPFQDEKLNRKPFTTYLLRFSAVQTKALRLVGRPGGVDEFVCLSQLAVFHRDFSLWDRTELPAPPIPHGVRLIPPDKTAAITDMFATATGLEPRIHYFDLFRESGYVTQQEIRRSRRNMYLANFLTKYLGYRWRYLGDEKIDVISESRFEPSIRRCFHGTLANLIAPIRVNNHTVCYLETFPYVVIEDEFDPALHSQLAGQYKIPWDIYRKRLECTPRMTLKKLESIRLLFPRAVELFTLVAYANRDSGPPTQDRHPNRGYEYRSEVIESAMRFMSRNLENIVSIGEVAGHLRLTTPYFSSLFKRQTGKTPSAFLAQLKIEKAKEYFIHTNFSVLDVAVTLNCSRRQLLRLFKQHTGYCPREYLQKIRT